MHPAIASGIVTLGTRQVTVPEIFAKVNSSNQSFLFLSDELRTCVYLKEYQVLKFKRGKKKLSKGVKHTPNQL